MCELSVVCLLPSAGRHTAPHPRAWRGCSADSSTAHGEGGRGGGLRGEGAVSDEEVDTSALAGPPPPPPLPPPPSPASARSSSDVRRCVEAAGCGRGALALQRTRLGTAHAAGRPAVLRSVSRMLQGLRDTCCGV